MAISFSCTACGCTLKVADELAGRKAKCPKCQAILFIPEGPASAMTAAAPPRKKAAPAPPPEEESADSADADGGEEAAPARRKKKKGKAKKSLLLPLLLVGGGVLVLLCGAAAGLGAWWYFAGVALDDYYFLPDNPQMVGVVHMDQLMSSPAIQKVRTEFPDFNQQLIKAGNQSAGIDPANVERMTLGGQPGSGAAASNNVIVVMHMKQPVKPADVQASAKTNAPDLNFTEVKVGRFTMYEGSSSKPPVPGVAPPPSFVMADDKRVVIGQSSVLRSVLQRDKKPDFSDKLQAAMKATDFNATVAFAANARDLLPKQPLLPAAPGRPGGPAAPAANPFEKVDGLSITATVRDNVDLNVTALCQDPQAAADANANITKTLAQLRAVLALAALTGKAPANSADLLDIQLQVSGSNLTATKTLQVAPLLQMLKDQQKAGPIGLPGPK